MCFIKLCFEVKLVSQILQLKGFFFSWTVAMCPFKILFLAKLFSQMSNLKAFFPSWMDATWRLIPKFRLTGTTYVTLKWILSFMNWCYMTVQTCLFCKPRIACITLEIFLYLLNCCLVSIQVSFSSKIGITNITLEIFLSWIELSLCAHLIFPFLKN